MLQAFADRARGTVFVLLQQQVAEDIDRLIRLLLDTAVALWEQNGWKTYNKHEVNYTVQLYRWCRAAKRRDHRFAPLIPQLEWVDVTVAMMDGTESVKKADRPDLRIEIGEIGRSIECKRLRPAGGLPRAYVHEGLARFVTGNYGHDEARAYMVGYVQVGPLTKVLVKINQQVADHASMGVAHQLEVLHDNTKSSWSRSCHARAAGTSIHVDHLLVDVSGPAMR
jgi:hypothetical protein